MATPQSAAPDTLPANFFAATGNAPDTLPANFFSSRTKAQAPATLPADFFSKQAAPETLPAQFFAQPTHDPNARFFSGSGQAEIRAYQPTIWQRIKQAVTAGIPNYSSRTIYNPKYGETQLVSPEEALTPSEQRSHPIVSGIGEVAGGLSSPQSIALLYGTAGLGELPGAAAMLPKLMSAGFGAQAIYSGIKNVPAIRDAWNRGDAGEVERLLTHTVLNLGMGALASQHAVSGKGAVSGKARAEAETPAPRVADSSTQEGVRTHNEAFAKAKQELGPNADVRALLARAQTILTEPTSPIGEVLHEQAPHVRVADSAAAAHDLLEKDTVARPVINLKEYGVVDPALAPLEEQLRGRAEEIAKKYPVKPIIESESDNAQARVSGPSDIAAFRRPSARVVSDSHVPVVSHDEILAHAVSNVLNNSDELQRAGVDISAIKTNRDVDAVLQRASDVVRSNLDPRAEATITFEMQKQLAADLGMSVEDLLSRRGGQAFNTEEALAARALLAQSAKHVLALAKTAAQSGDAASLDTATTALAQHQAIQENVAGITAEAGRALGGFRIDKASLPEVKIANVLSKMSPAAQAKAVRLLSKLDPSDARQLNQFIEKIRPSSTADKVFEYYRNALLSSPKTVTVKAASEATMMALEATKKVVSAGISRIKDPTPERFASESWWYAKGALQALQHTKAILTDQFDLRDAPGFEGTGRQAIKGPLGTVVRFPGTVLARQTNLMYVLNLHGEVNALAARTAIKEGLTGEHLYARQEYLAAHPTPEITEAAHQVALHNTFQSELGKFGRIVQGGIRNDPTGTLRYLFPFTKVPINLAKASAEFSPYGLFKGLVKGDVDAQARGLVGSSLAAGIAYLALNGLVTGGGAVDWRKKQTQEATGFQPYSLKLHGKYYSYHRLEPLGLTFGLVADAIHSMKSGDSEIVSQSKADNAVTHIERNLSDLPFLFQLSSIVDAIKDTTGKRVDSFIARQAASFIPAAVANVAEGTDRTIRHPTGNTLPEIVKQTVESRLPGLTHNVPAVIDITGQPAQRPVSQLGGANPFPWTTAKHDPVLQEIARLGISTPQAPMQIKWRGKQTQLTDAERQAFAQEEGQEYIKRVGRVMQSGAWQRRTDDQRRRSLVELHRMINESRPARLTRMRKQELARNDR